MIEHSRGKRLFLTVICFVLGLHLPAGAIAVSLEETKNLQDPFAFSRQLDYRHFDWFDYKGADIDDVAIYQVR